MSRKSPLAAFAALLIVASCAGPTLVMARDVGASVGLQMAHHIPHSEDEHSAGLIATSARD